MGKNTNPSPTFPQFPGSAQAVVPDNNVKLPFYSVIYVGGAGNVSVLTAQGDTVTFSNVLAGTTIPVQVSRVNAAGTTATLMVAVY